MWQKTKNIYHLGMAILANIFYRFPSRKLTVVGVTGTDGKTTTVLLVYHILKEAGFNSSMISTVGAIINNKQYDVGFHVTTPSPFALQSFLNKAARGPAASFPPASAPKVRAVGSPSSGVTPRFLVLETTSHSLDQYRTFGVDYDIGILTNVTHEHLDYHKTYENYVKAKTKLLLKSKVAVVNIDHKESYKIVKTLLANYKGKIITCGMGKDADINLINFPFKTNMIGEFNIYNCLEAIAAVRSLGVKDSLIRRAILSFKPPIGREEIVYKGDFSVMIDFAHTPNAFENILSAIRPLVKGRIIHVFGAAGLRDGTKRPIMGKISSLYANVMVLTSEDPRSESAEKIMDEIIGGIQNSKFKIQNYNSKFKINRMDKHIFKIFDRQNAINAAIGMAEKDDLVLVTGKSHEKSMNYGHGEIPWDEFETVKKALKLKHE